MSLTTLQHHVADARKCACPQARLAQSVERKALNLVVVGSSPTVGVFAHDPAECLRCTVAINLSLQNQYHQIY